MSTSTPLSVNSETGTVHITFIIFLLAIAFFAVMLFTSLDKQVLQKITGGETVLGDQYP